eukprot:Ihof_evm1s287 gene=Ihof_evmTU1s287
MPTGHWGLYEAIRDGKVTSTEQLLKRGMTVNSTNAAGQTALHVAARFGRLSLAKDLILHGCFYDKQDAEGYTPLHVATLGDHVPMISFLLALGADITKHTAEKGWTPLHLAVHYDRKEGVKALLKSPDATLDLEDWHGQTVIVMATRGGNREMVDILLDPRNRVRDPEEAEPEEDDNYVDDENEDGEEEEPDQ